MDLFGAQEFILWYKNAADIVFDKTAFENLRLIIVFGETHSNQLKLHRKIHTILWILKISRKNPRTKVSRLLLNVCDFQKENHTLGYGFKNL